MTRLSISHYPLCVVAVGALASASLLGTAGSASAEPIGFQNRDIAFSLVDENVSTTQFAIGDLEVDQSTGRGYVLDAMTDDLVVYDITGPTISALATVALGSDPSDLALNPVTHQILVVDQVDATMKIVDGDPASPTVDTVLATIAIGGTNALAIDVDEVANKAYVANSLSDNVSVIDIPSHVTTIVPVGITPVSVAVDASNHIAYVANKDGASITMIAGVTPIGTAPVSGMPRMLEFSGGRLLAEVGSPAAAPTEFRITAFDESLNVLATSPDLGHAVQDITLDEGLSLVYVALTDNNVVGLREIGLESESTSPLLYPYNSVVADPGSDRIYVSRASAGGGVVASFDTMASPIVVPPFAARGRVGSPFSFFVSTVAAPDVNQFVLNSGTLPTGLSLDAATGEISGTPTQQGNFPVRIETSNGFRFPASAEVSIVIDPATTPVSPTFTSGNPANGTVGEPYSFAVTASGSPAPTFSVTFGELPDGLQLDPASGVISGRPTKAGPFAFSITASNASGDIAAEYRVTIAPAAVIPTPTPTPSITASPAPRGGSGTTAGTGSSSTTTGGRLASTGLGSEAVAGVALAFLALGGGAFVSAALTRRRRRAH